VPLRQVLRTVKDAAVRKPGHAERSFAALPQETRAVLEAYARGVNAFIERAAGSLTGKTGPSCVMSFPIPSGASYA
jgi:acyl-homoserine lactone acylase PvdQ